jgi:hypothetical protein
VRPPSRHYPELTNGAALGWGWIAHDDVDVLAQQSQEPEQARRRKFPQLTTQQAGHLGLIDAKDLRDRELGHIFGPDHIEQTPTEAV